MNRFLIPADCGPILESLIFTTHWCGTLLQESKINGLIRSNKKRDERFRTRPPHTHTQTRIKWPLTGDLTTFYWKYKKRYFDHHHENFNRSVVLSIPNKGTNWNLRTNDEILPASLYWRLALFWFLLGCSSAAHTGPWFNSSPSSWLPCSIFRHIVAPFIMSNQTPPTPPPPPPSSALLVQREPNRPRLRR